MPLSRHMLFDTVCTWLLYSYDGAAAAAMAAYLWMFRFEDLNHPTSMNGVTETQHHR